MYVAVVDSPIGLSEFGRTISEPPKLPSISVCVPPAPLLPPASAFGGLISRETASIAKFRPVIVNSALAADGTGHCAETSIEKLYAPCA
ncbi:hypothetical protein BIM11_6211 [Burkholderia pseudomallei]|nr:hypothetical protein BIM11_6211 [Burkholderia pseudomallei]